MLITIFSISDIWQVFYQVISVPWCFQFGQWEPGWGYANINRSKGMSQSSSWSLDLSNLQNIIILFATISSWYTWKIHFSCTTLLKSTLNFYNLLIFHLQDNVFIISNPKSKYPVLQLDLRFTYNSFPFLFPFLFQAAFCVWVVATTN
jgi:hypothetical protein